MTTAILRLYPPPFIEVPLPGLYLQLGLHALGTPEAPFVYANFLVSLDGRIALEDANGETRVPKSLTSPNDFRLFLELEAQADCLITHGGYLRALAAKRLGNILQIGVQESAADLLAWRTAQGLPPQPAVVIASASLDFPMPASIREQGQPCYIATGAAADPEKIAHWRGRGYEVLIAGRGSQVEGGALTRDLGRRGYRTLYLIAGPKMLDTVVRERCLSRLFQTITHQLMGGAAFRTLVPGPELGDSGRFRLKSLYYDPSAPTEAGQWFAQFESGKEGLETREASG